MTNLTFLTGQEIDVSATVDLTPGSGDTSSLQLFLCYLDVTGGGAYTRFSDEVAISPAGTITYNTLSEGQIPMLSFSREGVQGGLVNGHKYNFGLCAIQTQGSSGGDYWGSSIVQNSWENEPDGAPYVTVGSSKVVVKVLVQ